VFQPTGTFARTRVFRNIAKRDPATEKDMQDSQNRPVLNANEARQGVTGHNVRYVLVLGLVAVVIAFAVGYLAARWLGAP
jgi:hypothetical protein